MPYGILLIPVESKAHARQICINTVRNNHVRWIKAGRTNCYFSFLADRYCPAKYDKEGNRNWKKNIKKRMNHKRCDCNDHKHSI